MRSAFHGNPKEVPDDGPAPTGMTEGNPRSGGDRDPALEALNAFVGTWEMEATFPATRRS